jgi:hypothetical protein
MDTTHMPEETLRHQGFSSEQIERLQRLRQRCTVQQQQFELPVALERRLNFIRWLIQTGRLTD